MRFREAYDPFRALRGAFRLIQRGPTTIIVGALVLAILDGGYYFQIVVDELDKDDAPLIAIVSCFVCVGFLVVTALRALFVLGFATALERVAVHGEERIGDLFQARGRFWSYILALLLAFLVGAVACAPFLVFMGAAFGLGMAMGGEEAGIALAILALILSLPGLVYVWLGVSLCPYAVAFERKSPVDALVRSWKLVKGNRLSLFWFCVVQIVFVLLGLLLCCFGIIGTVMISTIANFEAYLRLVRDDQASWAIEGGVPEGAAKPELHSIAPGDPGGSSW